MGLLQKIYNFNAGINAKLSKRIDQNLNKAWGRFEKGLEGNVPQTVGSIFSSNAAGLAAKFETLAMIPFALAKGATILAAKIARKPLDRTPKI